MCISSLLRQLLLLRHLWIISYSSSHERWCLVISVYLDDQSRATWRVGEQQSTSDWLLRIRIYFCGHKNIVITHAEHLDQWQEVTKNERNILEQAPARTTSADRARDVTHVILQCLRSSWNGSLGSRNGLLTLVNQSPRALEKALCNIIILRLTYIAP